MENKENIKHRMYKNAARLWDVKSIENLDPIIKLLIEALASEVYKLSTDINSIEIRLLERIAQMLTPDMMTIPQPAHMIMTVQPIEETLTIGKMDAFTFDDPYKKRASASLSFRPVGRFSLTKGYARAIICGGSFYTIDTNHNKEIFARAVKRSELLNNSIWIGLDIDKEIKSLKDLSLFLDFPNIPEQKAEYLPLLSFSQWSYTSRPIETSVGISLAQDDENDESEPESIYTQYDLLNMLDHKILSSYYHHYITIKEDLPNALTDYVKIPPELEELYSPHIQDAIESPLLWLKVKFPPHFKDSVLNDLTVAMNSFPVANKELRSIFSKSKKLTNVIPLSTVEKEYFLSVRNVKDEFGNNYDFLPYKNEDKISFGTYTIKRGGIERFDERDAKEYISNLIDLLREETVAFSMLGKDYLRQAIDEMKTKISLMEQKLRAISHDREISSYLVIDSDDQNESIFIDYWTTNCEYANNIKAGTTFKPDISIFVDRDTCMSHTVSIGGRSIPKNNNKLDMYKYVLTTRDRIYTPEDIASFCYSEFGDYFSNVEIKKGVQISDKPKEGLIRTIDVHITMKIEFGRFSQSKQEISSRLLKLLQEKSPDSFNYRIFIENKIQNLS